MDRTKKNTIKRVVSLVCIAALVAFLAAMPLLTKQEKEEDGPKASILSGTVTAGNIDIELIGGGTLTEADAVSISVPAAVKLTEFLVANGDSVSEGDAVASVDPVTVMTAITQVQETLEYLSEQIEEASSVTDEQTVSALAGGTVKILYAQAGDSVQDVMLEHGALAVLSLDGLMAVDLETESTLAVGVAVKLTFSDRSEASGEVLRNLAGEMTVTVEDDGYTPGDTVVVTDGDGNEIGSGELYIYSPWNATAYAGTVKTVKVSEGDSLKAGKALMVLENVGYSAEYRQLIGQRQAYEELMLDLFRMYQSGVVTAPADGVVSGIDKASTQLLSADSGWFLSLLANAPTGDDETVYSNFVGQIQTIADNGWVLNLNPESFPVADYLDLSGVSLDTARMTQTVLYTSNGAPVFTLENGAWVLVDSATVTIGDILLFATDGAGSIVWTVLLEKAQELPPEPSEPEIPEDPTEPSEPVIPDDPTIPTEPDMPTDPTTPSEPGGEMPGGDQPSGGTTPSIPGGGTQSGGSSFPSGSFPSGNGSFSGMTGGMGGMGGIIEQEPAFELYGMDMVQIAAVTAQDTMTLLITVDELDVRSLSVGMTALVRIDALGDEKHEAVITQIGNTGTNSGGSSKYTVELTMPRGTDMLGGMTATAVIVLNTVEHVLTIPADTLVEKGNETLVYTRYDEENDALLDPVTVRIGTSDGETVEVLEGLNEGQTYYYAYYDTLEISYTPDLGSGGGMFFGR